MCIRDRVLYFIIHHFQFTLFVVNRQRVFGLYIFKFSDKKLSFILLTNYYPIGNIIFCSEDATKPLDIFAFFYLRHYITTPYCSVEQSTGIIAGDF